MKNKYIMIIMVILILLIGFIVTVKESNKYNINRPIRSYDLLNAKVKNDYLEFLKQNIYPEKIRKFIDNDFVPTSLLNDFDTGNEMIDLMKFNGYKYLFKSLFDKNRIDFDDCPVTESFKKGFNTNLFNYFNLEVSDDSTVNCMLNYEDNSVAVEVYGNFKNTEPTYWTTHHFKYTLDKDGNVDDVTFDYTE